MHWAKHFNWTNLSIADAALGIEVLGTVRQPDLVISPDGNPYLYRWHIVRTPRASIYFHIQVADDPERPLHDHPWDNQSVILAGGYDEIYSPFPPNSYELTREVRAGDVVFRRAQEAHRLLLPKGIPYTMTLFSTGPKVRDWGFWYDDGWKPYTEVTRMIDGQSVHVKGETK